MNAFTDKEGTVTITEQENGRKLIVIKSLNNSFSPLRKCETDYPISLIRLIFQTKGSSYLCDEICRETDPNYVERDLKQDLTAYFSEKDFAGKRILDFGCGSGASSMILSRMFPDSEIIGVELEEKLLNTARARLEFYQYANVELHLSPSGCELPANIGSFDFVIMSAVYEHLLPAEREQVIPKIWSVIKPEGCLFLNMTPYRWFPIEHHTTGLPLINYLPANMALIAARKFSRRIDPTESWEIFLRRGIRGATENEIIKILRRNSDGEAQLIEPSQKQLKDRIDLWYSQLNQQRHRAMKKTLKTLLKAIRLFSGVTLVPNLSLVIKKH